MPSSTGILTSSTTRSGRSSSASRDGVLAVPGLADDVVAPSSAASPRGRAGSGPRPRRPRRGGRTRRGDPSLLRSRATRRRSAPEGGRRRPPAPAYPRRAECARAAGMAGIGRHSGTQNAPPKLWVRVPHAAPVSVTHAAIGPVACRGDARWGRPVRPAVGRGRPAIASPIRCTRIALVRARGSPGGEPGDDDDLVAARAPADRQQRLVDLLHHLVGVGRRSAEERLDAPGQRELASAPRGPG